MFDDAPRLLYLALLLLFIGGGTVLAFRGQLGALLKQVSAWALIFAAVVVGYGLFTDQRDRSYFQTPVLSETGRIEIPRAADGHYHVVLGINGTPVRFIVDTGATEIVLSAADARRAGIDTESLAYTGRARTANGVVRTAPVRLEEVALGGITDRNIRAVVNSGEMDGSLLGMRYLESFGRIEISGGRLILERG